MLGACALGTFATAAAGRTGRCGTVNLGEKTVRVTAYNMSCSKARALTRAKVTSSGTLVGFGEYIILGTDCEASIERKVDAEKRRRPRGAPHVYLAVVRGCNS